jgi:hypothetical protein
MGVIETEAFLKAGEACPFYGAPWRFGQVTQITFMGSFGAGACFVMGF